MSQVMVGTVDRWTLGAEAAYSVPRARTAGRRQASRQAAAPAGAGAEERGLVERLRAGDEAAFNLVVDRYHGTLVRVAMHYVADLSVAEEVAQDTWLAALEGIERFEGRSALKSWLVGIVVHKAKDRGVREKRYVPLSSGDEADGDEPAMAPSRFDASGAWAEPPRGWDDMTPERLLSSKEQVAALQRAIEALPANLREVLALRELEEMDAKDICALLKISESNLYVRLHRARERVRETMEASIGRD